MKKYSDRLDEVAAEFNKPIINELKKSISNICKYYQLSTDDLCKLFNIEELYMKSLTNDKDDDIDCLFDLRTITLLTLLSNGRLSVLSDTPNGKMFNDVNCIIKEYQDEKNPPKKENQTWEEKAKQVLDLFGVKNLDDLDYLIKTAKKTRDIIEQRVSDKITKNDNSTTRCECEKKNDDTCCHKNNKKEQVYVDANGNFHSQKPYTSNSECDSKINGSYFDSSTMDKPQEFEFTGNFDKVIPTILEYLSKKLF